MAKAKTTPVPPRPAKLVVPRAEARAKIESQKKIGDAFVAPRTLRADPDGYSDDVTTWTEVTGHLLRTLFDSGEEADNFNAQVRFVFSTDGDPVRRASERREDAATYVRRLESLLQRLDLFEEAVPAETAQARTDTGGGSQPDAVFVVHGHDVAAKQETARLLEKLKLRAVILDEQPNRGRTIIEKFEDHAGECGFAVVLLTPDDFGRAQADAQEKPRARQNVIFELGYFVAKLGRGRVCALHKGGLDLPSDIQGVIWVSFDDGAWTLRLAKEMRAAGVPVDMNLL